MQTTDLQIALEREYAQQNAAFMLKQEFKKQGELSVLTDMTNTLKEYLAQEFDYEYTVKNSNEIRTRDDLIEVHTYLREHDTTDVLWKGFTIILMAQTVTIQQLVGTLLPFFSTIEQYSRKLLGCSLLMEVLANSKHINAVITKGEYCNFTSNVELIDSLKEKFSKQGFILPSVTPPMEIRNNLDSGYLTIRDSVFMGNKLKQHNLDVCLDHINRVNNVPFKYEQRLHQVIEPTFNYESKLKKNGQYETKEDTQARLAAFKQLHDELPEKLAIICKHSDHFYLTHKYCNRLRTYVSARHYNYQGTKFLKAMIQFYKQTPITGEW